MTRALFLALLLALAGVTLCCARIAFAHDLETLTLARAAIAESGWHDADQRGVLSVLARRAKRAGITPAAMALAYVSAFKVAPTPRLRWVLAIDESCEQPAHWPSNLDWAHHEPECRATFERVRMLLEGELSDPCRGRADHFGATNLEPDVLNAERAAWQRVECGAVLSAFWRSRR